MSITSPQKDAQKQATTIERFWAKQGHPDVRCFVVATTDPEGRAVFGVRSNIDITRLGAAPMRTEKRR